MRISDWNSDVCSSELHVVIGRAIEERRMQWIHAVVDMLRVDRAVHDRLRPARPVGGFVAREVRPQIAGRRQGVAGGEPMRTFTVFEVVELHAGKIAGRGRTCSRSEEHTSELQSLMRISYAVFCL